MIILGIDTSTSLCSVALSEREQVLASFCSLSSARRSLSLLRMVDIICKQSRVHLSEVRGIAVTLGPGSFTSLRVGLATAQGIAMAYGIPIVGCSAFEALAIYAKNWGGMICPVINAYKGEVYAALYRLQDNALVEIMPGKITTPASLCPLVTEPTLFLGSGVKTYGVLWHQALQERAVCVECNADRGLVEGVVQLGYAKLEASGDTAPSLLQPLYIRPVDARLPQHPSIATTHS